LRQARLGRSKLGQSKLAHQRCPELLARLALGSWVGLAAALQAQAADLPSRKAQPVEYLRACPEHNVPSNDPTTVEKYFFRIPGSDTCLRIGGGARFEYVGAQVPNKSLDPSGFLARARITIDSRTATDWGLLRAYFRTDIGRQSGNTYFGSPAFTGGAYAFGFGGGTGSPGEFPGFGGQDTSGGRLLTLVSVSAAFVQFGGLVAGRLPSFFDAYQGDDNFFDLTESDTLTQALSFTLPFGNGFSTTLSIEDPRERQQNPIAGFTPGPIGPFPGGIGGINPVSPVPGFSSVYPFAASPFAAPALAPEGIIYTQRESIPDVVGALRVEQGWGTAQLSGAYHRIETSGSTVLNLNPANGGGVVANPLVPTVAGGYGTVHGNAYAFLGAVKINLPMIAAADHLWLQAAYSKGNLSYMNSGFPTRYTGTNLSLGDAIFSTYDAVVGPSGKATLTPAFSALAVYVHYWTPTIRQGLFGGLEHVSYAGSIKAAAGFAAGAACPDCVGTALVGGVPYNPYSPYYTGGTEYNVGTNLIWSPVRDLDIGAELFYVRNQLAHQEYDINRGSGKLIKAEDALFYRLRVDRSF